ncbi:MAG: hypothetical protein LBF77_10025 [Spirochaetaceae bacterium]|jgi:hypothetical protein|nr:hypothetical protein [Spirochaetaceae bacterium]
MGKRSTENRNRKVFLFGILVLLTTGHLFAQMPFPTQDPVKIGMGEMSLGGMMLTGFSAEMKDQEGNGDDGIWKAGLVNPVFSENRVDFYFNYKILDYGVFVNLRSQGYGQNNFGSAEIPHYHVYANFLDNKVKVSAGKLNDWIIPLPDTHVWQTWYNGEMWSFTGRGPGAIRLEIKPVDGLDFGFQFPFIAGTDETSADARRDAWKEFGFGIEYAKEKFKAVAGLQLDSKMDKMSRDDFRTYLSAYYGDANMLGPAPDQANIKFKETPVAEYDDGLLAFAGTRINLIDNFVIDLQIGLMGLGVFDKYGYGRANEWIGYTVAAVPGLSLNIRGEQQFYGSDVFEDSIINSPLITVGGEVSYELPFMKNLTMVLEGSTGFCQDVLDSQWEVIPKLKININKIIPVCTAEIFYKVNHTDYKDAIESAAGKPETNHSLNLAVSVFF